MMFEVAQWFKKFGHETEIVAIVGKNPEKFFGGAYKDITMKIFHESDYPKSVLRKVIMSVSGIFKLREEFKYFQPDIIVGQNPADAETIYFASLGLRFPYATFLYASFFNFPDDGLKYLAPFKRIFEKIRNATPGHKTFIPLENPVKVFWKRILLWCRAWINYFVVHRATCAFSMTRKKAWENEQLYHRQVIDIKGGVNPLCFGYQPKKDMKLKFGFPADAKILVDVSRLIPGKRIDCCIQTVAELRKTRNDIYFVVGGNGPEKEKLEKLIDDLGLRHYVILAGFIPEEDLLDFYAGAEIVFHPAWIDFDLTVMEGLSLGKKVVCSSDYDLSGDLGALKGKMIFQAEPDAISMARAITDALAVTSVPAAEITPMIERFTWEAYSQAIISHLSNAIR